MPYLINMFVVTARPRRIKLVITQKIMANIRKEN
jgi:hypothetical protein